MILPLRGCGMSQVCAVVLVSLIEGGVLQRGTGRCQGIQAAFEKIEIGRHLSSEAGLFLVCGEHQMCHIVQGNTQTNAGTGIRHIGEHMLSADARGKRWAPSAKSDNRAPSVGEMLDNVATNHAQRANDQGSGAVLVQSVFQSGAHTGLLSFSWMAGCG